MSFSPQAHDWHAQVTMNSSKPQPILSPTSAPQPSKAVPERKAKLRASCDACAASKVKCSKEHPICARCTANGSPCIYGVSRKHGKPGRTRKKNPDGTPFIKGSKQRPSPDGSEFGKFRVRAEPLLPDLNEVTPPLPSANSLSGSEFQTPTPSWPSTPEWPATPDFDYQITPEPSYADVDFSFMEDVYATNPQSIMDESSMQMMQSDLMFTNPFIKKEGMPLEFPLPSDFQALQDFIGGDSVNPMDYALSETSTESFIPSSTPPQSPKGSSSSHAHSHSHSSSTTSTTSTSSYANPLRTASIALPSTHSCYNLAYATLESLQFKATPSNPSLAAAQQENGCGIEIRSLDSVLSVTKAAVQNVIQLLRCPCAVDPHLAMLYSSITSKIITWYQIAAGMTPTTSTSFSASGTMSSTMSSTSSTTSSSSSANAYGAQPGTPTFTSSPLSSPSLLPSSTTTNNTSIKIQPLKIGLFEFDEADQEILRRQVVVRELKKCGVLVEALANWSGPSTEGANGGAASMEGGSAEQAEFLYDVLGAWLKSELYRTVRVVRGGVE